MNSLFVAVGIGNTTIKVGVSNAHSPPDPPHWSQRAEFPTDEFQPASLASFLFTRNASQWLVASVHRGAEQRLREWVQRERPGDEYRLLSYRDVPLKLDVESPERVGLDRLAAAAAANRLRQPDRAAVVVDAGTAITVNLVTSDGVFRGGVILPGFKLTARALAEGTDLLPLVPPDPTTEPPVIGRSTDAAIRSGLYWGNVGAVRELVQRVSEGLAIPPQVSVTGGDAQRLAGYITADARFVPDLVLLGIASCRKSCPP
jgi:type III pantothenate kinase